MKEKMAVAICVISTIIGTVIGWNKGEQIGIAQLPPNAWAGDGMGILDHSLTGSGWGALIGFGIGVICCLLWYVLLRWRRAHGVIPDISGSTDQV